MADYIEWKSVNVLVAQSGPTLCDPMDCSPPGPSVHGIFQEEHWSGLPFSPTSDLPNSWIQPRSPALQADSLLSEPPGRPVLNRSQSVFSLPNFLLLPSLHKHLTPLNLHALSCLPNPSPSGDKASLSTCPNRPPPSPALF